MPLTPEQLTGIRERTAETAKSYLLAGGQPSQMAQDREDLLAAVDELATAVERLIPEAHDLDSTKCRDRAAQQEALSPEQRVTAGYDDDDCPACDVQAVLHPEQVQP